MLLPLCLFFGQAFEVILSGGRVVDGTGNPWYRSDVGINADRIVAIGDLREASAKQRIDASGLVVAPGFIDIHSPHFQ
jgi:N-acyl-D-aspartate/D-glutamate deacylase